MRTDLKNWSFLSTLYLTICVAMTGCSSPTFTVQRDVRMVNVRWVIVDDIQEVCHMLTGGKSEYVYHACATWDKAKQHCTIFTSRHVTHEWLGHELQHCFDGDFHEKPEQEY